MPALALSSAAFHNKGVPLNLDFGSWDDVGPFVGVGGNPLPKVSRAQSDEVQVASGRSQTGSLGLKAIALYDGCTCWREQEINQSFCGGRFVCADPNACGENNIIL